MVVSNRIVIFILIFLVGGITSVFSQEKIIAGVNSVISNPSFSIDFPDSALQLGDNWYVSQFKDNSNIVTIDATRKRRIVFSMRFFMNPILSDSLRMLPKKTIADDFRNMELLGMNTFGVQAGMYRLENVQFDEETIGQRLFYTLTYKQIMEGKIIFGHLYLYFPFENNNDFMLVGHYAEGLLIKEYKAGYELQHLNLFKILLGNLVVKSPAQ